MHNNPHTYIHADNSADLNVRPVRDDDEPFLLSLRNEADAERLLFDYAQLTEEEKRLILGLQAESHRKHMEGADWEKTRCVIEFNGEPAGYFINFQDSEEIRLADIIIAGRFRGLGIGFAVVQAIQGEAANSKRPLRLHVEKSSPAIPFYQQLGFELLEDRGTHFFVEWLPPQLKGTKVYFTGQ